MSVLRHFVGGVFAVLGSVGAASDAEASSENQLRRVPEIETRGFRGEGPGYLIWDESRAEVEEWQRSVPSTQRLALVCGACHQVLQPDGRWAPYDGDLAALRREASHGLCSRCARERFPDLLGDA